jgi:hypothetical protein
LSSSSTRGVIELLDMLLLGTVLLGMVYDIKCDEQRVEGG